MCRDFLLNGENYGISIPLIFMAISKMITALAARLDLANPFDLL